MSDNQQDMPPWLQPVLEQEDDAGFKSDRTRMVVAIGATVLIAAFAIVIAYMYLGSDVAADRGPLQVAAPSEPIKERPSDVGGMRVEDREKDVFDRVSGDNASKPHEIGQTPEEPVTTIPESDKAGLNDALDSISAEKPVVEADKAQAPVVEPKPEPKPVKAQAIHGFRVQLGAYSTQTGAEKAWAQLAKKYASELSGLTAEYQSVARSGGSLFRLRVGTIADRAAADRICLALKAKGQGCIVVAP